LQQKWATYKFLQNQQPNEIQKLTQQATEQSNTSELLASPSAYTIENISDDHLDYESRRMQVANWALVNDYASHEFQIYEDFVFDNLLDMRDLLSEKNISFMVVAYPDSFQVDESLLQVVINHYQIDISTYQLDRPQGILWQFTTNNDIEFYDMLATFQEAAQQGERLYIHNDSHWNEAGNQLAAEYLYDILVWKTRDYLQ